MLTENYLFLIVAGLILGVIFFYFLCETLIRLERRKAESKSRRYKSFDGKEGDGIYLRKASAPPGTAAAAGGYLLLPLSRGDANENSKEKVENLDKGHKPEEDPTSPDAWKRQDSAGNDSSFAERKEDPWICKNGAAALATPTSKPIVEETPQPVPITTGSGGTGVTETVAIVTAAATSGDGIEGVVEVTKPAFSTAGFWEAREAAKHGDSSSGGGGYLGSSGYDSTGGGGYNSSSGGYDTSGGGFGNEGSPAYAWGGGSDLLTEKTPGWGQSSEI